VEEFSIRKTPTDMERGENAIEKRFAQAFSFDFDIVETSLAGWAASAFKNADIYPWGSGEGLPKAEPDHRSAAGTAK
jgi:hypothetical protein